MALVEARPAAVFGCRPGVSGGVCFLQERLVLHAAGAALAQFHTEQRWHKFIPGAGIPPSPAAARPRPDPTRPDPFSSPQAARRAGACGRWPLAAAGGTWPSPRRRRRSRP